MFITVTCLISPITGLLLIWWFINNYWWNSTLIYHKKVCCGICPLNISSRSFNPVYAVKPPTIQMVCLAHPTNAQSDWNLRNSEAWTPEDLMFLKPLLNNFCSVTGCIIPLLLKVGGTCQSNIYTNTRTSGRGFPAKHSPEHHIAYVSLTFSPGKINIHMVSHGR